LNRTRGGGRPLIIQSRRKTWRGKEARVGCGHSFKKPPENEGGDNLRGVNCGPTLGCKKERVSCKRHGQKRAVKLPGSQLEGD